MPDSLFIVITASYDIYHFTEMIDVENSGFSIMRVTNEELLIAINDVLDDNINFSKEFHSATKKVNTR